MKDQGFYLCELTRAALSAQKKVYCHYLFVSANKTNDQWWFWELYENARHRGPDITSWFHVFEIWIQDFILVIYSSSNLEKNCQQYKWLSLGVSLNHSVKRLIQTLIHSAMKKVSESLNHSLNRLTRVALRFAMLLLWLCLGLLHWRI